MPDRMIWIARMLSRTGAGVVILCGISVTLWSQDVTIPALVSEASSHPFVQYDETLTSVADALLTTAAQIKTVNVEEAKKIEIPQTILPKAIRDLSISHAAGVSSIAAARLDLLRAAIEPILQRHAVPTDLAAVVLVESGARANALSAKGARGLWQLMPDTARRYGLRVDDKQDDRLDLLKATDAAAGYLHDLYAQFGDWRLALAAYNAGEANVGSAIQRAHTRDFDQLAILRTLPLETRNYVPRVLAAAPSIGPISSLVEIRQAPSAVTVFALSTR